MALVESLLSAIVRADGDALADAAQAGEGSDVLGPLGEYGPSLTPEEGWLLFTLSA